MKNAREKIDNYMNELDNRWRKLPVRKQRKYTLWFFIGYMILAIGIFIQALNESGSSGGKMTIERIENQVLKKDNGTAKVSDTTTIITNRKIYENRK